MNKKKETAVQDGQQLVSKEKFIKELQNINKNLKDISDTLIYI